MKEYYSVKEFAKLTGIEASTLRFWDQIGLFSPAKRNPENNYRYYLPDQLITVNFVTVLSSLDIKLKEINEIKGARNPEKLVRLIKQKEKLLDMEMRRLRECYSVIHTRLEMIEYGIAIENGIRMADGIQVNSSDASDKVVTVDENTISVMYRDDMVYNLGPRAEWKDGEEFHNPFIDFCQKANELHINLNFPIGGYHDDWEGFMAAPGKPHHFFSIDPTGNRTRKAGDYVIGFSRGYYGQFGDLSKRMNSYIEANALNVSGPVYVVCLQDEICTMDPSRYLAQACVAVTKKRR